MGRGSCWDSPRSTDAPGPQTLKDRHPVLKILWLQGEFREVPWNGGRAERGGPCAPRQGQTPYIGCPESPTSSCSNTCSRAAPGAMEPLLVIFARAQILVFLLRTVWDNDRLLVEAEHDLSSNKSSSALLGKSPSVPIYNLPLFLFSLLFSLNVRVT